MQINEGDKTEYCEDKDWVLQCSVWNAVEWNVSVATHQLRGNNDLNTQNRK